jgi:CheY-like chemotaxis protein
MPRVRLIHWKEEEAREHVKQLEGAGYQADVSRPTPEGLRSLSGTPPDAILIDLSRMPSHGRDIGLALRQRKSTRFIPLVFVGGDPEKIERLRTALPDAVYTEWRRIRSGLKKAIAHPLEQPHVPASVLEGYSGTPLPKKLGIKSGFTVAMVNAPDAFERALGDVPDGVTLRDRVQGACDLILWFVRTMRELDAGIGRMSAATPAAGMWIIWPKKASGTRTDLDATLVRETAMAHGLVDFKVCAVDTTWSGFKFSRRKKA